MTRKPMPERDDGPRRRRTIAVGLDERAQTTQDFAVGIGVFILAIAFVFAFLPSMLTPYDGSVGGAETAQADRIADRIVADASSGTANELNSTAFDPFTKEDLSEGLALRANESGDVVFDNVNVTVEDLEGDPIDTDELAGGEQYDGQASASAARTVTVDGGECEPACRLVVRVW